MHHLISIIFIVFNVSVSLESSLSNSCHRHAVVVLTQLPDSSADG